MKIICVIPARLSSTRLKNKPLVEIAGYPLIRHVYENASRIGAIDEVIVAADDRQVVDAVNGFGGNVVMTPTELKSGTDRVAHVIGSTDADVVVNLQCDEPFIVSEMIDTGIKPFIDSDAVVMGSLKTRIKSADDLYDPNVVKVVTDKDDNALYFSRFPIPYMRDRMISDGRSEDFDLDLEASVFYKHLGIYFYRPTFLQEFSRMPECSLERAERLEQLRALYNGYKIKVPTTEHDSIGIDTEEDLSKVRNIFKGLNG